MRRCKTVYFKLHERQGSRILACCDEEIAGKELEFGETKINVREEFYKGEKASEKKLIELLSEADSANLMGKKSVEIALKSGFAEKGNVVMLGKVPHCQLYFV
ncbi:MAG: DUF424 family protein [archaeon]